MLRVAASARQQRPESDLKPNNIQPDLLLVVSVAALPARRPQSVLCPWPGFPS